MIIAFTVEMNMIFLKLRKLWKPSNIIFSAQHEHINPDSVEGY